MAAETEQAFRAFPQCPRIGAAQKCAARGTDFVRLPGLNHLLTRAVTGDVGEYGSLSERTISPAAVLEISSWLKKALAPEPSKSSQ